MPDNKLKIKIVSQERELVSGEADQVTAQTADGQVTILPGHLPLFTRLTPGELVYRQAGDDYFFAVSKGFLDVGHHNSVIVMVDIATDARDISLQKAEQAIKAAHETITKSRDQRELMMAEASLRQAMLEVKIARKSKKTVL